MFLLLALALLSTISYADAPFSLIGDGFCRPGGCDVQNEDCRSNAMVKIDGSSDQECEAMCEALPNCTGYAISAPSYAIPNRCYVYGQISTPFNGWMLFPAAGVSVEKSNGSNGVKCYKRNSSDESLNEEEDDTHWVTKGRHEHDPRCDNNGKDCSTQFELNSELHGVRCCGDESSTGKFVKNEGCSVFGASRGMGQLQQAVCQTAVSYSSAANICEKSKARLCTIQELKNNCAAHTGCGLDFMTVWSSDADPNLNHSPITTIPTLKPSARSTPTRHYAAPRFHNRSKHKCTEISGDCSSTHALNSNIYAVSCCKTTPDNHWFQNHHTIRCQNVWSASGQGLKHKSRCTKGTWYEAHHVCEENGARLCSKQELLAGCAQSTGCQFDGLLNWSMD